MFRKLAIFVMMGLPMFASAEAVFKGNWTQYYILSNAEGKTIELFHTPEEICLGGFMHVGNKLTISSNFNGIQIRNLEVEVNSTMEEFEYAIAQSNLTVVMKSSTPIMRALAA